MILVLLPQEGKGQEEDKSTQGDEKDKGQGHLCLAQGLHPDQGLDQGQGTGIVDMMVRYRIFAGIIYVLFGWSYGRREKRLHLLFEQLS